SLTPPLRAHRARSARGSRFAHPYAPTTRTTRSAAPPRTDLEDNPRTTTRRRRRPLLGLRTAGATTPARPAPGSPAPGEDPAEGGEDGGTVRVGHLSSSLFTPLYVAEAMD